MDAKEIFEQYKIVCPNSISKFNPTDSNVAAWLQHIRVASNNKYFSNTAKKTYDPVKLKAYSELVATRKITSHASAPAYIKAMIEENVSKINELYSDDVFVVYLEGSYTKGGYVDAQTTTAEKDVLKLLKDVTVNSDMDFSVNGFLTVNNFWNNNDIIPITINSVLVWKKEQGFI